MRAFCVFSANSKATGNFTYKYFFLSETYSILCVFPVNLATSHFKGFT